MDIIDCFVPVRAILRTSSTNECHWEMGPPPNGSRFVGNSYLGIPSRLPVTRDRQHVVATSLVSYAPFIEESQWSRVGFVRPHTPRCRERAETHSPSPGKHPRPRSWPTCRMPA